MLPIWSATALQIALFGLLIVAAYTDLIHQKIYNWLTLPAIGLGLGLNALLGDFHGVPGLESSLQGFGLGFGIFFVAYVVGGVGGGDVKLVAAIGAIMGASFVISSIFWSALAGSLFASSVLIWRGRFWLGLKRSLRYMVGFRPRPSPEEAAEATEPEEEEDDPGKLAIPYGFAIAVGTFWSWFLATGIIGLPG